MKKSKMSVGAKIALIFGLVLILAGAGWWIYTTVSDNNTPGKPVATAPSHTGPTDPIFTVDKLYTEFFMPNDKGSEIEDEYLDLVLVEAGRLYDNEALKNALNGAGVSNDGYYFLAELTYDSTESFKGLMPFGYLNGTNGDKTEVAAVQFYVANSDLSDVKILSPGIITPGCHYVMIGYSDYNTVDNAQIHLYNSDYNIAIIHMRENSNTIVPHGYTKADSAVSSTPDVNTATDATEDTEPVETSPTETTGAVEGEE